MRNHLVGLFGAQKAQNVFRFFGAFFIFSLIITTLFIAQNLLADVGAIDPNGNGGTSQGVQTTCGGAGNYDCVNDGVSTSSTPSTSGDYLTFSRDTLDFYLMESVTNVDTVSQVDVYLYHVEGATNMQFEIGLYDSNETTQFGSGLINLTNRSSSQWDTASFTGLSLTQTQIDNMRVRVACRRTSGGAPSTCTEYTMYADVVYMQVENVTVSTTSNQQNLLIGTTSAYIGGIFVITENTSSRNITSIEIEENGTVDALNDLENIKLHYDLDTSDPYNCVGESYSASDTRFGATSTSFSSINGTTSFNGTQLITTTQAMCVYVVLDVATAAQAAQTIEIEINDPSTDVGVSTGVVGPSATRALGGTTILEAVDLTQIRYHWRDDDGNEAGASSLTGGNEGTAYDAMSKQTTTRLRMEVSNEGNIPSVTSTNILDPFTTGNTKTVSNGINRLLVVGIHSEDSLTRVDVNTVTYGGQILTQVDDEQVGGGFSNGMWVGYLNEAGIAAASGNTISPTWTGGIPDTAVLYSSVVFENVDQSNPVSAWSGNTGTSVSTIQPTTTIAVSDGDMTVYFTTSGSTGQTHTAAAGYTEGTEEDSGGSGSVAANAFRAITVGGTEQPTADWINPQNRLLIVALTVQFGHQFRLEYAQKISTCAAASGWIDVGAGGGEFDMSNTVNLTDGSDTTNIAVLTGGVTDENTTFLTPNGGVKDASSQTGNITLTSSEYVELEYAIEATSGSTEGNTYCFRVTNAGAEIDSYNIYPEATIAADLLVSATSTQLATIDIPTTNVNVGGGFVMLDQTPGTHDITSVTITASGTVDYQSDLDNIELWYDLDQTAPYDCTGEVFGGDETQFGSTDTDGFSVAATSTFTDNVTASTTQAVCLYVVLDVGSGATNGETLDIQINDPTTDIVISSGTLSPAALVSISGVTTLVADNATQIHYHWRNDDGNEAGASSATGGNEDTVLSNLLKQSGRRLRIGISNQGGSTTPSILYRLEYAQKISTCSVAGGWIDVGAGGGAWDMFNSFNITDGDDTTDIAVSTGGVSDENATFLINNNAVKDTSSQTSGIVLDSVEYTDLEYSIEALATAISGATYCFRVTNTGTTISSYDVYPEASIREDTDFFIQRGVSTIIGTSITLTAGIEYTAPAASTSAFIRITNTHSTGAGNSSASGNQNADDATAYIVNPWNIETSIDIARATLPGGDTRVAWEIVEYVGPASGNNEMVVRQQDAVTYGTGALIATATAASGIIDHDDVVVFITGQWNPDTGRNDYNTVLSTSAWSSTTDEAVFTRGEAGGDAVITSYTVVEFIGSNWAVQRKEHTYTSGGSTETESITTLNSLSRTFVHVQKRVGTGLASHANFGHEVWLSSVGQVSFLLDSGAGTPGGHTSVAWIIENTQTIGVPMVVTRSNGLQTGGTAPLTLNIDIGKTLVDVSVSSIFMNNRSTGGASSYPEPMIAVRLTASTTQYEIWMSNTGDTRNYRTEIVEWPTAPRSIEQNYYRFYVDDDTLAPTDPWPAGGTDLGENTAITGSDEPLGNGDNIRIRMTLLITGADMPSGIDAFKLQYGERTGGSCSSIAEADWHDIGDSSSTTVLWRGFNAAPADGAEITALRITSVADVMGTYEEENNTSLTPNDVLVNEDIEFDWNIQNNNATEKVSYCFRMTEADDTLLEQYNFYPTIRTAGYEPELRNWRWYDDEGSVTPITPLAATNTAPIDITNTNIIKLRTTVAEISGALATNTKFKLQFSEYSNFSTSTDVMASSSCVGNSLWCFADGGGGDNATVTATVLADADTCSGGIGTGCGTHNEAPTTTSTHTHSANAITEFEFTIQHNGARANAVYFFRLYDVVNDAVVAATTSNPSLVTEGATLVSTVESVSSSTVTEGITADIDTTPTSVPFGDLTVGAEIEGVHRFSITTNATGGYKIFVFTRQDFTSAGGNIIASTTGTNAAPIAWAAGCPGSAVGCLGYHAGDDTLDGGSTRFSANDTYAGLTTTPEEIVYSSIPVTNEITDIVYKLQIRDLQEAGQYESKIVYIAVPVF